MGIENETTAAAQTLNRFTEDNRLNIYTGTI